MITVSCQCIPNVDGEVLTGLVPRLVDIFKSGVGLGTKVCEHICIYRAMYPILVDAKCESLVPQARLRFSYCNTRA